MSTAEKGRNAHPDFQCATDVPRSLESGHGLALLTFEGLWHQALVFYSVY